MSVRRGCVVVAVLGLLAYGWICLLFGALFPWLPFFFLGM